MGKNKESSMIKKMSIALISAFIVGIGVMLLKVHLNNTGNAAIWDIIDAIFFVDIREPGASGLGILFLVGQVFLKGLQLSIIPLVFTSLALAMSSITDLKKLGRIAFKTVFTFMGLYVCAAVIAGSVGMFAVQTGIFQFGAGLTAGSASDVQLVETANPLATILAFVPENAVFAFSSNQSIFAVVFIAVVIGVSIGFLGSKVATLKKLIEDLNEIVAICLDVLMNKMAPYAIFALIVRAFALYGFDQIRPVLTYISVTIVTLIFFLLVAYPVIIAAVTKLNPKKFMKELIQPVLIAFSAAASAPALPLNIKINQEKFGVSGEIANFVLPLGMTINMNGTSIMHIIGTIFIATVSGYHVTLGQVALMGLLSMLAVAGTPSIPAAGTVLLFTVVNGLGFTNDTALLTYSLILAINKPVEMVLTPLNIVGDAATSVMVAKSEGELDTQIYKSA